MQDYKKRSIAQIEEKMTNIEKGSFRYQVLEYAKQFKASWVGLGRALYSVWKDKYYKEWGFVTLDAYASKEIGIRKNTVMKLLRSYYFLEKEEPQYVSSDFTLSASPATIPSYESVDLLRLAKNKKVLDKDDYAYIKKEIFEDGKDYATVKKDLTALIRQRQELMPEEAQRKKRQALVRRLYGTLKSLHKEAKLLKLLPASLLEDIDGLLLRIETELS
ncbi:MAG: hypothetical protein NC923_06205 [Candidatus Omnitrophica bacterium]|nr:hypothetical protein [Candidatus Omnitrophota bacterium]